MRRYTRPLARSKSLVPSHLVAVVGSFDDVPSTRPSAYVSYNIATESGDGSVTCT